MIFYEIKFSYASDLYNPTVDSDDFAASYDFGKNYVGSPSIYLDLGQSARGENLPLQQPLGPGQKS